MAKNVFRIPQFIKAKTPEELILSVFSLQVKNDIEFEYQIVYDGKFWFAWFQSDKFIGQVQLRAPNVFKR
jgi:hypothetical protein